MGGLAKKMPLTFATFTIGVAAIIGLPFLAVVVDLGLVVCAGGFAVWATAGVHPQQALTFGSDDALIRFCGHPLVKAIGELGIDPERIDPREA